MKAIESTDIDLTYRRNGDAYHFQHEWEADAELGTSIVLALEHILGEATDVETSLHDVIDPDALERVFTPLSAAVPRDHGEVSFRFAAAAVVVYANGRVVIRPNCSAEADPAGGANA